MEIVIITGMSGSGKSEAMNVVEDMGYYTIDNLPPELLSKVVQLSASGGAELEKIALGVDVRGFKRFNPLKESLEELKELNYNYKIIFLEASDDVLIRRYKISRRKHPLSNGDDIIEGIRKEREIIKELKEVSNNIIDTSELKPIDLRNKILKIFNKTENKSNMSVVITSFGFKHGIPIDTDLVFDVRFLPNPYYVEELKNLTGNDSEVFNYVMEKEQSQEFFKRFSDFVNYLLPNYMDEGKNQLIIGIGCTGGKHRSVTMANKLYDYLKTKGYDVFKKHRDIEKQ